MQITQDAQDIIWRQVIDKWIIASLPENDNNVCNCYLQFNYLISIGRTLNQMLENDHLKAYKVYKHKLAGVCAIHW